LAEVRDSAAPEREERVSRVLPEAGTLRAAVPAAESPVPALAARRWAAEGAAVLRALLEPVP
jgi:hypothetical protein